MAYRCQFRQGIISAVVLLLTSIKAQGEAQAYGTYRNGKLRDMLCQLHSADDNRGIDDS